MKHVFLKITSDVKKHLNINDRTIKENIVDLTNVLKLARTIDVALTDESSDIAVEQLLYSFRIPYDCIFETQKDGAGNVKGVPTIYCDPDNVPTGAATIFTVSVAGTVLCTITIDDGGNVSTDSSSKGSLSFVEANKNDNVEVSCTQIGSTNAGSGYKLRWIVLPKT